MDRHLGPLCPWREAPSPIQPRTCHRLAHGQRAAAVPLSPDVSVCECPTYILAQHRVVGLPPRRVLQLVHQRLAGFAWQRCHVRPNPRAATHDQAIVLHPQRPPPGGAYKAQAGQHQQSQPTPKAARQHQGARLDAVAHPPLQRQQSQCHRRGPAPSGLLERRGPGVWRFAQTHARGKKPGDSADFIVPSESTAERRHRAPRRVVRWGLPAPTVPAGQSGLVLKRPPPRMG